MRHPRFHRTADRPPPRGFTVMEGLLAITLAAGFCAITLPLVVQVGHQRRAGLREQVALVRIGNVLDDLTTCDAAALEGRVTYWREVAATSWEADLPRAALEITTTAEPSDTTATRLDLRLSWLDRPDRRTRPLAMTGWRWTPDGGTP